MLAQARAEGKTRPGDRPVLRGRVPRGLRRAEHPAGRPLPRASESHRPDDRPDRQADRDRPRLPGRRTARCSSTPGPSRATASSPATGSTTCGPATGSEPATGGPGQAVPRRLGAVEGRARGAGLTWDAPWGTGFPGWHIECSAMSLHYLGETIDMHTGGIDLRFPHHEDERAQSNTAAGHEVVRHWVHGEHLLFDGRKMAKSTGNVVLLDDLAARGLDPLALRLAFLDHRYRQQMNLTWDAAGGRRPDRARAGGTGWPSGPARRARPMCAQYVGEFTAAFDDDLDTPAALRVLRAPGEGRRDPARARSSRRSRTPTSCSAWTWPGTSAGGPRRGRCPDGRGGPAGRAGGRPRRGRLGHRRPAPRRARPPGRHGHRHPGRPGLDRPRPLSRAPGSSR